MRRIAVTAAVFLFAIEVWAGDPWKEKSYRDWSEKDVYKILMGKTDRGRTRQQEA